MAPGFFSKLVKPPTGSRHSSDRSTSASDGLSPSRSRSPKSPSSPPRSPPISSNHSLVIQIQPSPSPSHASLSSDPSVTVIPPSPRSYSSSFQSDRESTAAVSGKEEKKRQTRGRPTSLVNLDHFLEPETDTGMPTPTPVAKNTLGVNGNNNAHTLTPSSSTGNLRDRVRSVVSRSSSRSRSRTNQAEPPAPPLPAPSDATSTATVSLGMQTPHAQPPGLGSNGTPSLTIVPPASSTSITGTSEFQTSPTSVGGPTPKTRAFTVPVNNPIATASLESQYLTPDRVKDSDSISIASTASGRKRRLWRRSSTTTTISSNTSSMAAASPKRKATGLASALVASMSSSGSSLTASPSTSPPHRKGSVIRRSPALSGHHAATSQSSVETNTLQLSPQAIRSRHNSLSTRPQEQDGYASSDGHDEDADDDSDDDELLAELNDGDIPVTGFAVASNKRNADFHELFRTIPEGDYLIEGASIRDV